MSCHCLFISEPPSWIKMCCQNDPLFVEKHLRRRPSPKFFQFGPWWSGYLPATHFYPYLLIWKVTLYKLSGAMSCLDGFLSPVITKRSTTLERKMSCATSYHVIFHFSWFFFSPKSVSEPQGFSSLAFIIPERLSEEWPFSANLSLCTELCST